MAEQGQPETPHEKSLLFNYGGAFFGVMVGALGGTMLLGNAVHNPPMAAAIGGVAGGVIGFAVPSLLKAMGLLKAQ
jgi:CBS-domain-containing membrane protein